MSPPRSYDNYTSWHSVGEKEGLVVRRSLGRVAESSQVSRNNSNQGLVTWVFPANCSPRWSARLEKRPWYKHVSTFFVGKGNQSRLYNCWAVKKDRQVVLCNRTQVTPNLCTQAGVFSPDLAELEGNAIVG